MAVAKFFLVFHYNRLVNCVEGLGSLAKNWLLRKFMKKFFGEMLGLRFSLIASIVLLPMAVWAQDSGIKVLEQNGQIMGSGVTKLVIKTKDDKRMSIEQVLEQSSISAVGPGGYINGSGATIKPICIAPAELELPNGFYKFNFAVGGAFNLNANGGTQTWELKDGNNGELLGGSLTFIAGVCCVVVGPVLYFLGTTTYGPIDQYGDQPTSTWSTNSTGLVIGIIGLAATVGGIVLLSDGSPRAKLVEF